MLEKAQPLEIEALADESYSLTIIDRCLSAHGSVLGMLEQLRAKGYLAPEVHQTQSRNINNQLAKLKKERQTELDSHIIQMLDDVKHLKTILEELEDPLERFDEKLFTEVVKAISIDHNDEMTLTMIGGLRFTELI